MKNVGISTRFTGRIVRVMALVIATLITAGTQQASGDITSGLVAHWKFDETTGTSASDSTGNGNTGTLVNGPTWTPSGKISYALDFDGANDYVTLGDDADLEGFTDMTLSAWVKIDVAPNTSSGFFVAGKERVYKLDMLDDRKVRFLTEESWAGSILVTPTALSLNTWYHIVAVKSGTTKRIYINNVLAASLSTTANTVGSNGNSFDIGAYFSGTPPPGDLFNGIIDDVRIYNRALTPTDVTELYNYPPPPIMTGSVLIVR